MENHNPINWKTNDVLIFSFCLPLFWRSFFVSWLNQLKMSVWSDAKKKNGNRSIHSDLQRSACAHRIFWHTMVFVYCALFISLAMIHVWISQHSNCECSLFVEIILKIQRIQTQFHKRKHIKIRWILSTIGTVERFRSFHVCTYFDRLISKRPQAKLAIQSLPAKIKWIAISQSHFVENDFARFWWRQLIIV